MGLPPNHPLKNRVFHYFHHPFWGTTMFGNTQNTGFHEMSSFNSRLNFNLPKIMKNLPMISWNLRTWSSTSKTRNQPWDGKSIGHWNMYLGVQCFFRWLSGRCAAQMFAFLLDWPEIIHHMHALKMSEMAAAMFNKVTVEISVKSTQIVTFVSLNVSL